MDTNRDYEVGVIIDKLDDIVDWVTMANTVIVSKEGMRLTIEIMTKKIRGITNQHRPEDMLGD